jgi:hypothetical protein
VLNKLLAVEAFAQDFLRLKRVIHPLAVEACPETFKSD